jgi:hypothetical protein
MADWRLVLPIVAWLPESAIDSAIGNRQSRSAPDNQNVGNRQSPLT